MRQKTCIISKIRPREVKMSGKFRILFICTHNSARSIMAEALIKNLVPNLVLSFSAGTQPGFVREQTILVLEELGISTKQYYSKSITSILIP